MYINKGFLELRPQQKWKNRIQANASINTEKFKQFKLIVDIHNQLYRIN